MISDPLDPPILDSGFWGLDFGVLILDSGSWILGLGISFFCFLNLDFGVWIFVFFWILDLGFWVSGTIKGAIVLPQLPTASPRQLEFDFGVWNFGFLVLDFLILVFLVTVVTVVRAAAVPKGGVGLPKGERKKVSVSHNTGGVFLMAIALGNYSPNY